jgi:hypothetical protein
MRVHIIRTGTDQYLPVRDDIYLPRHGIVRRAVCAFLKIRISHRRGDTAEKWARVHSKQFGDKRGG